MRQNAGPSRFFLIFFRWYCRPDLSDHIEGDLLEEFSKRMKTRGNRHAQLRFIVDVLLLFRPGIIRPVGKSRKVNNNDMLNSYFKIGWRNMLKSKGYSIINIAGLATGMAVAMLIGLWTLDELNYDKYFKNYDRIGKLYHHLSFDGNIYTHEGVPHPFGIELKNNIAGFETVVMATDPGEHILGRKDASFTKTGMFVGPDFFDMFSIQMLEGTGDVLKNPHSVALSRTLAEALLGDNPVGQVVRFENQVDLMVTGVFEDFPTNTSLADIQMLLPLGLYFSLNDPAGKQMNSWETYDFQCFVLLNDEANFMDVSSQVKKIGYEKGGEAIKSIKPDGFIFPMEKWHLHAEFKDGKNMGGKIQFVWMFGIVGVFVLLLACINFMNLSTGRSDKRSKEVGIRKVMGSSRRQLINQFFSESALTILLAFVLALGVVMGSLPWFNELANKKITLAWDNPLFILTSIAFIFLTTALAGSYPALYLSSFNPVKVLKGTFKVGRFASLPRKMLVIFQFTISTALVIGTIIVFQQIQHAKDRPVGFDREGIIHVKVGTQDLAKANYNTLRNDLLGTGVVENMAKSDFPVTGGASADPTVTWEGKDPSYRPLIAFNSCSHDFPQTNGFQIVEGRDFSREHLTDSMAVIVNETAAKLFPGKSAIGRKITFRNGEEHEIVAVIRDQVRNTPFTTQWPHIYFVKYGQPGYLTIRLSKGVDAQIALANIQSVLKKYDPGAPFEYKFLDDDYARLFNDEERIGKLASVFTALAIFISCLGIFGLASFTAGLRNKEIGIRKVLGASVLNVWQMLSRDFVGLVILSALLAGPIAYYFSHQWLQKYEYRIGIEWWVFAITVLGSLVITLLTVSYQCIKAALADPINSLRSE